MAWRRTSSDVGAPADSAPRTLRHGLGVGHARPDADSRARRPTSRSGHLRHEELGSPSRCSRCARSRSWRHAVARFVMLWTADEEVGSAHIACADRRDRPRGRARFSCWSRRFQAAPSRPAGRVSASSSSSCTACRRTPGSIPAKARARSMSSRGMILALERCRIRPWHHGQRRRHRRRLATERHCRSRVGHDRRPRADDGGCGAGRVGDPRAAADAAGDSARDRRGRRTAPARTIAWRCPSL